MSSSTEWSLSTTISPTTLCLSLESTGLIVTLKYQDLTITSLAWLKAPDNWLNTLLRLSFSTSLRTGNELERHLWRLSQLLTAVEKSLLSVLPKKDSSKKSALIRLGKAVSYTHLRAHETGRNLV